MPGRIAHVVSSSFVGALASFVRSAEQPDATRVYEIFGGFVGGYLGGRAPDVVDCARNPNHRGLAHSVVAGAVAVTFAKQVAIASEAVFRRWAEAFAEQERVLPENSFKRALLGLVIALCRVLAGLLTGFVAGYAMHLCMDGTTPRSLAFL